MRKINTARRLNRAANFNPFPNPFRLSLLLHLWKYKHEIWLQFPCHQNRNLLVNVTRWQLTFALIWMAVLSRSRKRNTFPWQFNKTGRCLSIAPQFKRSPKSKHERVKRQGNTNLPNAIKWSKTKRFVKLRVVFSLNDPGGPTNQQSEHKLAITRSISHSRSLSETQTPVICACRGRLSYYLW